jgi:hypothetical protein
MYLAWAPGLPIKHQQRIGSAAPSRKTMIRAQYLAVGGEFSLVKIRGALHVHHFFAPRAAA